MAQKALAADLQAEGMTGAAHPIRISPLASLSLRNDAVTIGPILPDDTAALFLWLNDVASLASDMTYRPVDFMGYNSWLEGLGKNPALAMFAIRGLTDPKIIGFLSLSKIDSVHRSAELGIRIGAEGERGKGYGTAAARLGLQYAFRCLNLNRVHLSVFAFNERAIRAYQAAGFAQEGRLRQAAFINGGWTDVIVMGALRPLK